MQYTTKTAIENYLLIDIDSSFNSQITEWIEAMSEFITNRTNRDFGTIGIAPEATKKVYDGSGTDTLDVDGFVTLEAITIDGESIPATQADVWLYPTNSTPKSKIVLRSGTFTAGRQNVEVEAAYGYGDSIPALIKWACTVLVAGIINTSNRNPGSVQQETIGRYSVTYTSKEQLSDYKEALKIIDQYRNWTF